MLAEPRQIHHEGVLELAIDLLLHGLEVLVLAALGEFAAENLLPVRAPFDLFHPLAGDEGAWPGGGGGLADPGGLQMGIIEGEGFVVVVDFRQVGVHEYLGEHAELAAEARGDFPASVAHPAALPLLLVLPVLGIADAGLGLDVVEPGVFDAVAAGPDVFAGDRAGMAADAFVEVENHCNLSADLHDR